MNEETSLRISVKSKEELDRVAESMVSLIQKALKEATPENTRDVIPEITYLKVIQDMVRERRRTRKRCGGSERETRMIRESLTNCAEKQQHSFGKHKKVQCMNTYSH